MTCEEHDEALHRLLKVVGPKYGDTVSGQLVYDGPKGKNLYLIAPNRLTPSQRTDQIDYVKQAIEKAAR